MSKAVFGNDKSRQSGTAASDRNTLASSLIWASKKHTPKELTNGAVTVVLPAVVKVTLLPETYERSCSQMAINTVFFVRGFGKEQRVAVKSADEKHFFSLPLESPIKFRKVFQHERGPAVLLKNLLNGKVDGELNIEIFGGEGNNLSSTPDMKNCVSYGTFRVVGLYTDTVLYAQEVLSESGELSTNTRIISVSCPARFDIATGFLRKNKEDFKQFLVKMRSSQWTKTTEEQTETRTELVLMASPTRAIQEMQFLEHICQLYSNVSKESQKENQKENPTASKEEATEEGATSIKEALEKLKKSSKQESIPLVDKPIIKAQNRLSIIPPLNGTLENQTGISDKASPVVYDDGNSNLHSKSATNVINSEQKLTPTGPIGEKALPKDSKTSGPIDKGTYLNNDEINSNIQLEYECLTLPKESHPQQGLTTSLQNGDYLNGKKLQLQQEEKKSTKNSTATKPSQDDDVRVLYEDVPYDTQIHTAKKGGQQRSSDRLTMPLPAPPPPRARSKETKRRFSLFSRSKPDVKKQTKQIEEMEDEDYVEPEEPWKSTESKPRQASDDRKWKTASEVPKNIKSFTINDIALCLELLNMARYIPKFRERNVDGAFLIKINKKMLIESFQMQEFEAKQLIEFAIKKWRPKK